MSSEGRSPGGQSWPDEGVVIADARPEDMDAVRDLIREHVADLGRAPAFRDLKEELDSLSTLYGPPRGALLAAREPGGRVLACGALKPLPGPGDCEARRLQVVHEARGTWLGRRIGMVMIERARALGYCRLLLETQMRLPSARRIYTELGFEEIPPYYPNPAPGSYYLALDLTAPPRG